MATEKKFTHKVYGPLKEKSLRNILIRKLIDEYGYSDKTRIAELLVDDFLKTVEEHLPSKERLLPGQMVWLAVSTEMGSQYGKKLQEAQLVPVILTLVAEEDLNDFAGGKHTFPEIRKRRIARMVKEAREQGGALSQSDIAAILSLTQCTVSRYLKKYEKENALKLPTRGVVDTKRLNHKEPILALYARGYAQDEIAEMVQRDERMVEQCIHDFERVRRLATALSPSEIARITNLNQSLVNQYLDIMHKYFSDTIPQELN